MTRSAPGRTRNSTGVVPRSRESARAGSGWRLEMRTNARAVGRDVRHVPAAPERDRRKVADELPLREVLEDPDVQAAIVEAGVRRDRHPGAGVRPVGDRHGQRPCSDDPVVELDLHAGRPVAERDPERPQDRHAVAILEALRLPEHRRVHPDRGALEERLAAGLTDVDLPDDAGRQDGGRRGQVARNAEHPGDVHDRATGQDAKRRR